MLQKAGKSWYGGKLPAVYAQFHNTTATDIVHKNTFQIKKVVTNRKTCVTVKLRHHTERQVIYSS